MAGTPPRSLRILGCRGIPAAHGGFETFAEKLAPHLVERNWRVTVYCQAQGRIRPPADEWRGVRRVFFPESVAGPVGTILFDARAVADAARAAEPCLVLGYNTAAFLWPLHRRRIPLVINMDGIEWQRAKWGPTARAWLFANERLACRLGDLLVADHPEIAAHLARHARQGRIVTIPYGADLVTGADAAALEPFAVAPDRYVLVVARLEPENSIDVIVEAFSRRARGLRLLVVGPWSPDTNRFHRRLARSASDEVRFAGAVYDRTALSALRFHARFYVHGHRVGGTNPSLVEALGAGNAILAHDNRFNRWVAADAARYFTDVETCTVALDDLLASPPALASLRQEARRRHAAELTWPRVLTQYEALLERAVRGN